MKRALTGAILIHAAAILIAAAVIKGHSTESEIAYIAASVIGFLGFIALIAAAVKKDIDPKD